LVKCIQQRKPPLKIIFFSCENYFINHSLFVSLLLIFRIQYKKVLPFASEVAFDEKNIIFFSVGSVTFFLKSSLKILFYLVKIRQNIQITLGRILLQDQSYRVFISFKNTVLRIAYHLKIILKIRRTYQRLAPKTFQILYLSFTTQKPLLF
jgi:hypothetical protein